MTTAAPPGTAFPLPPHPKDLPIIGSMADFARNILGTIFKGWHAYGDVVRFRGMSEMCLVAHPDSVRTVLETRLDIFPRSNPVKIYLRPIVGEGLLISEGALWARQRRMVAPLTHGAQAAEFSSAVLAAAGAALERLHGPAQRGEAVDFKAEMAEFGIDVMSRTVFGRPKGEPLAPMIAAALEYAGPRVMMPVNPPDWLTPPGRRYLRTLRELDATMAREISERRAAANPAPGMLTLLARTRDAESGEPMPDKLVRDEAVTAAFGFYKGIAPALTWAFYLLARHPPVWEKLQAELKRALAGRAPAMGDLGSLSYTRMIVDETLRLYPPLWIFSRPAMADTVLGGFQIKKGVFVLMIPYVTHRHPDFWQNPEAFDPERFAPGKAAARHPYAYIPFGGGPRGCTGDELGPMAVTLVLAAIAQRYRPRLIDTKTPEQSLEFILRPKGPLRMRFEAVV